MFLLFKIIFYKKYICKKNKIDFIFEKKKICNNRNV